MKLILLGPQGSGKGTQAELLVKKHSLAWFSMGDALRAKAKEDSDEGRQVQEILNKGELVPNEITDGLVKAFVDANERWVVDGYPRNMGQAGFFDTIAEPDAVLVLEMDDELVVKRLGGRRVCPKGHIFHTDHKPPKQEGVCDEDGLPLKQRDDDVPDAIRQRLEIFHEKTKEVLEHYKEKCITVDASGTIEEVDKEVEKTLTQHGLS